MPTFSVICWCNCIKFSACEIHPQNIRFVIWGCSTFVLNIRETLQMCHHLILSICCTRLWLRMVEASPWIWTTLWHTALQQKVEVSPFLYEPFGHVLLTWMYWLYGSGICLWQESSFKQQSFLVILFITLGSWNVVCRGSSCHYNPSQSSAPWVVSLLF